MGLGFRPCWFLIILFEVAATLFPLFQHPQAKTGVGDGRFTGIGG